MKLLLFLFRGDYVYEGHHIVHRFYYHELDEHDALAIKNDIALYNSMLHKAYKMLCLKNKGVYMKSSELHKALKKEFGTNDYFPLSVLWKAQLLLKLIKQKKQQLKRIEMKITEKQKKIDKLDKQIQKLVEKTRQGKQTKADYLKEVQVLKSERKRRMNLFICHYLDSEQISRFIRTL